ncbi:hypothetical protein E3N88_00185 [Mikania micrantha]|uniref:F-box associated beta-propeller type 1 domain-containing protein n=1 Tax=Mikania micrantha TaxID=192012 RepID=A0A5N6PXD9_9ASTR|nr:hypothetical protein E3N88_00185 [Mikania micrantha]
MFVRRHLQSHGTINDHKLLLVDGATLRKVPFTDTIPSNPPIPSGACILLLATLDGLVLLATKTQEGPTELVFLNPLTGAYRKLSSYFEPDPNDDFGFSLFYDVIGFYKDDSCNDYKLVYLKAGGDLGAYIYSHRLDTWRAIDSSSFAFKNKDGFSFWSPATLFGQCLYFIVTTHYWTSFRKKYDNWIMCFDVKTETFRKIQFPPFPDADADAGSKPYYGSLVILNGRLHLYLSYSIDYLMHRELWRMDGDGDGWLKLAAYPPSSDEGWHCICTASAANWVAVMDQETNSFKKLNAEDFTRNYRYFCSTSMKHLYDQMIYVESLVSPNM